MPCGKCCGHLAKRGSVCACGRGASGDREGQDAGQDNDGSDGSDGSEGQENEAGSSGSSALNCAKDATSEGNPSKEDGNRDQGPQLLSWVDSAPAATSPRAVRRTVETRRPVAGRRRARDLEGLDLALGIGRGC